MALDAASALASVKIRLDISSTDFDAAINEFVASAVKRLAPIALKEVDPQEVSVTVGNDGEAIIDLSTLTTPLYSVRRAEISSGTSWRKAELTYHQGENYHIRDLSSSDMTVKLFGLARYVIGTVPDELHQAIYWFAMSEFYDYLAGNKRKYNIYMGSGARMVDNMRDESDVYEQKANDYLNDRVELYGVS